jgi:hypothetical protein
MKRLPRGLRALANCAPIASEVAPDRRMRAAISRAKKRRKDFAQQQAFDRAMADLVKSTPVPAEIAEWFANEKLAEGTKRNWRNTAGHPAILAIGIALAVIAVIAWIKFDEQMHTFAGESTAKKLLSIASSTRVSQFEPVKTDAGTLSDLFVMKYRLEHYDVPPEFSQLRTIGVRVFDDEEAGRVAQIGVAEKRMQFFLFPARRDSKTGQPEEFQGWRYLEQEGWTGAIRARKGVLFMATVRGPKKDLAPYLPKE